MPDIEQVKAKGEITMKYIVVKLLALIALAYSIVYVDRPQPRQPAGFVARTNPLMKA